MANIQEELDISCPEIDIRITRTRQKKHGDFTCNVAMIMAQKVHMCPMRLANMLIENMPDSEFIKEVKPATPGFINFFLENQHHLSVINDILRENKNYGHSRFGGNKSILIEFVSANPTGPLHVGHGRNLACGSVISNLLEAIGYNVEKEYYINDAGRQMDILAISVWLRYLEKCNIKINFPKNIYQGDYILHIADKLFKNKKKSLCYDWSIQKEHEDDPEAYIDSLIESAKSTLGNRDYRLIFDLALEQMMAKIRQDIKNFGVEFDHWSSERSIVNSNKVQQCIDKLRTSGLVYHEAGNLWFQTTKFGDTKDRVLVRSNGTTTYFASDIAYHMEKFSRGYEKAINIWGADHHGYISRLKAAITAMSKNPESLEILLIQFVTLHEGDEKLSMSTRSGTFTSLEDLQKKVGKDVMRFFYIMRKSEQHLNFDIDLAKLQSEKNPVYYIQYAHARICSLFKRNKNNTLEYNQKIGLDNIHMLDKEQEKKLSIMLLRYPETLHTAAVNREPHRIAYYLRELANEFHNYYNSYQIIVKDNNKLRNARLSLIGAVRQVIANGLKLLEISAPESM